MHGRIERITEVRRVRAYKKDERKRLIIHVLAEAIRRGETGVMTCAEIARSMDIVPSTKLRKILLEMIAAGTLSVEEQPDGGIAGKRYLYWLNKTHVAYSVSHANAKAVRRERTIRLNTVKGSEEIWMS